MFDIAFTFIEPFYPHYETMELVDIEDDECTLMKADFTLETLPFPEGDLGDQLIAEFIFCDTYETVLVEVLSVEDRSEVVKIKNFVKLKISEY